MKTGERVEAEAKKLRFVLAFEGIVAGTDEAGRGPLAGPLVAAAAVLTKEQGRGLTERGLRDSKRMTPRKREEMFRTMREMGVAWEAQAAGLETIERLNILGASLWAMGRSVLKLPPVDLVVTDGPHGIPGLPYRQVPLTAADDLVPAVSAASVVAKVLRDRVMMVLDRLYPGYGFARHKGYPTREHRDAVRALGLSPVHRPAFCAGLTLPAGAAGEARVDG
ncbi:MAG: ribonuclease HII [Synergistaceae bacterium]|jgi:ribonuclease HII|nr:ribonuclease HII [Synergistaceae bacterium]